MIACSTARTVSARPRRDRADLGEALAELEDICDRYAGRHRRRRGYWSCWLLVRVHGLSIADVAALAGKHPRTIRERLDRIYGEVSPLDRALIDELLDVVNACRAAA